MIDDFSNKLMKFFIKKNIITEDQYPDWDFYFRFFLFNFMMISSLLIVNLIFHSIIEIIIVSIMFNLIRVKCINNGYHCNTLEKCLRFTVIYLSFFAIIAHVLLPYYIIFFIISILGGIYIYEKYIPSKICIENEYKYIVIFLILICLMTIGIFLCSIYPKIILLKQAINGIALGILSVVIITCDKFENIFRKINKQ